MESLMSFCAQSNNDLPEIFYEFNPSKDNGCPQHCNDCNANFQREQNLLQDRYQERIKHQEKEIDFLQEQLSQLEDDYSKMSISLITAEKKLFQTEKMIRSYKDTIDLLKNELENFYCLENFNQQSNSTLSDVNLSFSNDSNIKVR